ncbi:MAG: DNA alkylation repair protein [Candidatus Margulisbacteria bacterium]|nr:DNA alkylation repair protein [Candidatus Margulisiibacteriota bacterium]
MQNIKKELAKYIDPEKAKIYPRFFMAGIGEYGEGDIFIGVTVPNIQKIAKKYINLPFPEIKTLLSAKIHEYRCLAVHVLIYRYQKGSKQEQEKIAKFYLANLKGINNWDLVDISTPKILGHYLFDKDRSVIYKFSKANSLWLQRISIMTTFYFIRQNDFADTLKLAKFFLNHKHDLIHKAAGWMLREIGKRDKKVEVAFLNKHYKNMPRTMLRYAIEKFPKKERIKYLKGSI